MSCEGKYKDCAASMGGSGVPAGSVTAVSLGKQPAVSQTEQRFIDANKAQFEMRKEVRAMMSQMPVVDKPEKGDYIMGEHGMTYQVSRVTKTRTYGNVVLRDGRIIEEGKRLRIGKDWKAVSPEQVEFMKKEATPTMDAYEATFVDWENYKYRESVFTTAFGSVQILKEGMKDADTYKALNMRRAARNRVIEACQVAQGDLRATVNVAPGVAASSSDLNLLQESEASTGPVWIARGYGPKSGQIGLGEMRFATDHGNYEDVELEAARWVAENQTGESLAAPPDDIKAMIELAKEFDVPEWVYEGLLKQELISNKKGRF